MELGPDVPDKATKVGNKEIQPEMGPGPGDDKEIQPEMGPGPGDDEEIQPEMGLGPGAEAPGEQVGPVPSRVRLRTKTPDASFNSEGGHEKEEELTNIVVATQDRQASPPPKRMRSEDSLPSTPGSNSSQKKFRQMSIAAMFRSPNCGKISFNSDEQIVQEMKGKLQEKMSFAEKEAILKEKFQQADIPYVPNGTRDRFGRPRTNVGGRPKKQMACTERTHRRPGTKRSRLEFPAPELLAMGQLVKSEIDKFWQKHSEQREDKALQKQLDQRLLTLWPGWKLDKIKQTADKSQMDLLRERCKELHLGKMSKARFQNPRGSTLAKFKLNSQSLGVRKLMGEDT